MSERDSAVTGELLGSLLERAKELSTLYRVEELLSAPNLTMEEVFHGVIEAIPPGWQYPRICRARLVYGDQVYESAGFSDTPWVLSEEIVVQGQPSGRLDVSYSEEVPQEDQGPFLDEEVRLLKTIVSRLADRALHQRLRSMFEGAQGGSARHPDRSEPEWRLALTMLRRIDEKLLLAISRKMMNHLLLRGIDEARPLLQRYGEELRSDALIGETNQPQEKTSIVRLRGLCDETFDVAAANLPDEEIMAIIQKWVHEDKSSFLTRTLANIHAPLSEISDAVERYLHLVPEGISLPQAAETGVRVDLVRRLLGGQLEFINIAKRYLDVEDFAEILRHVVCPPGGQGRLGGKSAGLILAGKILDGVRDSDSEVGEYRIPRAWYVTSDALLSFLNYNDLEDLYEHKYRDIEEVRQEYPHIVQVMKNSHFPHELIKGLSMVIDDLGEVPLIVRSSSQLEDRIRHPFSGKYKSLFVANQGTREERLEALLDAIAEVFASVFGPDPIEYRTERGLLDFNEEMAVLIQEVVGRRIGKYWFPAFAGVAFSTNEMRWSARIRREDGLLRIVPGLGTRAVDRLSNDYPVLVAVGQPKLRVNASVDEVIRYSPQQVDVINLDRRCFETLDLHQLLAEVGRDYPALREIVSEHRDGVISPLTTLGRRLEPEALVVTFDGLIERTPFLRQLATILRVLQEALGTPVDVEFAVDGAQLYLLQCRPQSRSDEASSDPIPTNIPHDDIVFTASRFVSNGRVPDLTHVVYVDPDEYASLPDLEQLRQVGVAIGKLNQVLPRRQFTLMGPGRWGSRGDIKLGVRVTYSDINNTSLLIEVARRKGRYVPDVSFGTHFFQDLVDSQIRYLPLYPDDDGVVFNHEFLLGSPNLLGVLVPEFSRLARTIRVIDVPAVAGGRVLRVLMNAEDNRALAYLVEPVTSPDRGGRARH